MKILGYDYIVTFDGDANTMGAMGRLHPKILKMQIAKDLNPQQVNSTIIHEVIEALDEHLELELRHPTIMALEAGLYQFLVDNGVDLSPLLREAVRSEYQKGTQ